MSEEKNSRKLKDAFCQELVEYDIDRSYYRMRARAARQQMSTPLHTKVIRSPEKCLSNHSCQ
eukprot:2423476-Amphidinium_carterae.1